MLWVATGAQRVPIGGGDSGVYLFDGGGYLCLGGAEGGFRAAGGYVVERLVGGDYGIHAPGDLGQYSSIDLELVVTRCAGEVRGGVVRYEVLIILQ